MNHSVVAVLSSHNSEHKALGYRTTDSGFYRFNFVHNDRPDGHAMSRSSGDGSHSTADRKLDDTDLTLSGE